MLIERIKSDLLTARKNRATVATNSLTALVGEAVMVGKNSGNRDSTDEEVCTVVRKFIKNLEETRRNLTAHNKATDVCDEELKIISQYLPKQLACDELKDAIVKIVLENPGANLGLVMRVLKEQYSGLYDGKAASELANQILE